MSESNSRKILLMVSGSIAAFKSAALCSKLVQAGYEVEVALSKSALEFIGPASFEGLTRKKPHFGNFDPGTMMAHIDLERNADLILNYPSTATTLSSFVHGNGESLLGAIFLAHEFKKPFWIAPAMNQAMLANPATLANIGTIENWGARVLFGDSGNLACGETGAGRLMEPDAMFAAIEDFFSQKKNPKKILVTAGGTTEKIDSVRSIVNFSTGETGYRIAKALQTLGHEVTLLQSKRSSFSTGIKNLFTFDTTQEFGDLFSRELRTQKFDTLIHAAAVSDYAVESVATESSGKTFSGDSKIQGPEKLLLTLKLNPKWIKQARELSLNKSIRLISFKLTSGESDKKLENYDSEFIFHNDLKDVSSESHVGTLYQRKDNGKDDGKYEAVKTVQTKNELVQLITELSS